MARPTTTDWWVQLTAAAWSAQASQALAICPRLSFMAKLTKKSWMWEMLTCAGARLRFQCQARLIIAT